MKTFTQFFFLMLLCLCGDDIFAQVKIGDNPTSVNPNSLLELESTTKGLLLPRLTNVQIQAMTNVPTGMLLFSITDSALYLRKDTGWAVLGFKTNPVASPWAKTASGDIYNTNNGSVGVGTDAPSEFFTVKQDGIGINQESDNGTAKVGFYTNHDEAYVQTHSNTPLYFATNNGFTDMTLTTDHKVGIGTSTPAAKLEVNGNIKAKSFEGDGSGLTGIVSKDTLNKFVSLTGDQSIGGTKNFTGKVGISTSAPFSQLANTPNNVLDEQSSGGDYNSLTWSGGSNGGYAALISSPQSRGLLVKTVGTNYENSFEVMAGNKNSLSVKGNGNVGIGTNTPAAKLDVNGDISYSGTLNMGVQYITYNSAVPGHSYAFAYQGCPTGTKLIGGGGGHRDYNSAQSDITVNYSGPDPANPNQWRVLCTNSSGNSRAILVYAICAKVQ